VLLTAAAMAARTTRIKIGTAMLLLPLHRPIRVAEDVAVLDNIANGRFILGVAAGYRPIEFEGLGEGRKGREARMEEQLEILIKSWTTEQVFLLQRQPVDARGQHCLYGGRDLNRAQRFGELVGEPQGRRRP
jgi:alkanesulfonate monooxygenase SsuD/methylene tetrahydromethanopterin reductase-like flavin-dependent oxidoreductase (luciferase family)